MRIILFNLNTFQVISYRAQNKTQHLERIVCEVGRDGIPPGESTVWTNIPMLIPPLPPSHCGGKCSIIDIEYYFQVISFYILHQ